LLRAEEIIVAIEILRESEAAAEDAAATTEGESRCLQEIRRKLKELGVQEGRVSDDFGKDAPPEKRASEIGY
jgi:hypothetical protein